MSVYIYTMPKAGTYFLAKLLSNLGLNDTGYHLARFSYLDTKAHPLAQNAVTPGIAKVEAFFVTVVRQMAPGDVAFGHFPLPLNPSVAPPHMKYVCSYRHPKKTLVSEFIDFRFRRTDIKWISPATIPDTQQAFEFYLERHGSGPHLGIFKKIVYYFQSVKHPLMEPKEAKRVCFVNFETVLKDPQTVEHIAGFLEIPVTISNAELIHRETLAAETKTKAVDLTIDREALWTKRAQAIYQASDFPRAVKIAQEQGMQL